MSAVTHLAAVAEGRRPDHDGLIGNARCEWQGVESMGEEAILAMFSRQTFAPGPDAVEIVARSGAAWIGPDCALVADLYDGRVGRLWRLGPGDAGEREPRVDVAFDPDLSQARGDVLFRREDHPDLDDAASVGLVETASAALALRRAASALRVRGFVVRAFGSGELAAALLAVYTLSDGSPRSSQFGYAALAWGEDREPLVVFDALTPCPWNPRL